MVCISFTIRLGNSSQPRPAASHSIVDMITKNKHKHTQTQTTTTNYTQQGTHTNGGHRKGTHMWNNHIDSTRMSKIWFLVKKTNKNKKPCLCWKKFGHVQACCA